MLHENSPVQLGIVTNTERNTMVREFGYFFFLNLKIFYSDADWFAPHVSLRRSWSEPSGAASFSIYIIILIELQSTFYIAKKK